MYSTDIVVYGAEVWCMDYLFKNTARWESSLLNFLLEEVHIRFLKIIMGLNKSAVNIAVLSETGRFPMAIYGIKILFGFGITWSTETIILLLKCIRLFIRLQHWFL